MECEYAYRSRLTCAVCQGPPSCVVSLRHMFYTSGLLLLYWCFDKLSATVPSLWAHFLLLSFSFFSGGVQYDQNHIILNTAGKEKLTQVWEAMVL